MQSLCCRWSALNRQARYKKRFEADAEAGEYIDEDNPLPGLIDPITLQPVVNPAISQHGHVMGLQTWKVCCERFCSIAKGFKLGRSAYLLSSDVRSPNNQLSDCDRMTQKQQIAALERYRSGSLFHCEWLCSVAKGGGACSRCGRRAACVC